jgi:uncharacterized protein YbaA (DUF1428 family)
MEKTGNHLEIFFYRVPKKNHDALVNNLKKFEPWFEKRGIGLEYYRLSGGPEMGGEGFENIAKALAVSDNEDIWAELQYYKDRKHCEDTFAEMMKDKDLEPLGKEFFGLITQGKNLITGGFGRLE